MHHHPCNRWLVGAIVIVGSVAHGVARSEGPSGTRFGPAENGHFTFDTGMLRGVLQADGTNQGIVSLVDVKTGTELVHRPGALSFYRVFASGVRYGDAARYWPTVAQRLPDGAVEVRFPARADYPVDLTAVFRWQTPDTLDVETTVTSQQALSEFEVFLSSYFAGPSRGLVYVRPNCFEQADPRLMAADVSPLVDGTYLMFPRDRPAILTIFDGRWDRPPHPVQWSITRWIAGPLAVRRFADSALAVALMAPPTDCFAVSMPYNKIPPDGPAAHASLYLSLFGGHIEADRSYHARSRMVVLSGPTDQQIIQRYDTYLTALGLND